MIGMPRADHHRSDGRSFGGAFTLSTRGHGSLSCLATSEYMREGADPSICAGTVSSVRPALLGVFRGSLVNPHLNPGFVIPWSAMLAARGYQQLPRFHNAECRTTAEC